MGTQKRICDGRVVYEKSVVSREKLRGAIRNRNSTRNKGKEGQIPIIENGGWIKNGDGRRRAPRLPCGVFFRSQLEQFQS